MKIDATPISSVGNVQTANRLNQVDKKTPISESDKVAVSDKAQVYQLLLQKVKELPSVREERVRALTEQIERGDYKVDGEKIAEKLFSPE
ncbi:MAG: flagellar biosynthesis anti-sigma factor FlgM [Desulfosporosinus sp. BRH_c37]|nr:MAG: flagellar biosynthesis anti-sigma factor FlgM [Desulfosporosinus sp. BRH_c37]